MSVVTFGTDRRRTKVLSGRTQPLDVHAALPSAVGRLLSNLLYTLAIHLRMLIMMKRMTRRAMMRRLGRAVQRAIWRAVGRHNIEVLKLIQQQPLPVHGARQADTRKRVFAIGILLVRRALGLVVQVFGLDFDAGVAAGNSFAGDAVVRVCGVS